MGRTLFREKEKMSRKYLNDKYCVRCGRKCVTPYLARNYDLLLSDNKGLISNKALRVVDLGCGNGRNSDFMRKQGHKVWSFDMVPDYKFGIETELGKKSLQMEDKADIILCNYVLMFLNDKERKNVIRDIKRIAAPNCKIIVQLYPAKDSYAKNKEEMIKMQKDIFEQIGWEKIKYSQEGFVAKKENRE